MNEYQIAFAEVYQGKYGYSPHRDTFVEEYAWAIPSDKAIDKIAEKAPTGIVEIGAGSGYWAMLLREKGIVVHAYDKAPGNNHWVRRLWNPVEVGGPEKVDLHQECALMLCWPPYEDPMAADCLKLYRGDCVIYIGEQGGCTGDEEFACLLEKEWELTTRVGIPQWYGINDAVYIYRPVRWPSYWTKSVRPTICQDV